MTLIQALTLLKNVNLPVLKTREAANILGTSCAYASQILRRLQQENSITRLKKGLWLINKTTDSLLLAPYITAPFPSYLSLQSALYFHGMISQIPDTIYLITIARSQHISTPIGEFSLHHVNTDFFSDFKIMPDTGIAIATPEKAIIDFFYLSPSISRQFKSLPEVELPKKFNINKAKKIIRKITSKRTQTLVLNKFSKIISMSDTGQKI